MLVHSTDINTLTAHDKHPYSKVFLLETIALMCHREVFKTKLTRRELPLIYFRVSLTTGP